MKKSKKPKKVADKVTEVLPVETPKPKKPANPLADMEKLMELNISMDEISTAIASYSALDDNGRAMVQPWFNEFAVALADYDKIHALRTPQQWKMYTLLGLKNSREQDLLTAEHKKIKALWRARPGLVK